MMLSIPYSWLTVVLLYSTAAQSLSLKRQSNVCPSANYTAPNGLEFTTTNLCLHDISSDDVTTGNVDSLEACMNLCAAAPTSQLCAGVAYNYAEGTCFLKNETVLLAASAATQSSDTHSAIAVNLDQNPNITCPYPNGTQLATSNGMQYQVFCDQNVLFNDYCPLNGPDPQEKRSGGACPFHADSLDECMQLCSESSPLCKAVAYNPDMYAGYGNCYVKTDVSPSDYVPDPSTTSHHTHMGVAIGIPTLDQSCTNGTHIYALNGVSFQMSCNESYALNDLAQVHASNLSSCVNACANSRNATASNCAGAVFDSTLTSGWLNCWLKTAVGSATPTAGMHFALKTSRSIDSSSTQSDGGSGYSTSQGYGLLVGLLLIVVAIGAGIVWCFRRRRARKQKLQPAKTQDTFERLPDTRRSLDQVHHIGDHIVEPQEAGGYQIHELPDRPS